MALLEDKQLVEIMLDRPDQGRLVGDIYLGKVEAVLPGIQAAFVDIGTDKAGFLHASDLVPENDDDDEQGGGGRRNRKQVPIQDHVQKGQELLVQVTKEPIGTKGPRITTQISLPGRFLVFMPFSNHVGVSRRIDHRGERSRLRKLAKEVVPKDSGGVIIRTVGEELNKNTFQKEFKRLHSTWKKIQQQAETKEAPALVRSEAKLISGVIRDLFSDKFDALIVDNKEIHNEILQYLKNVDPELKSRVQFHAESVPLFEKHNVDVEIQRAFRREVELPSGGYIVIEPTEALVSIDVNTGKFTGKKKKDPEHTILKTNLDAAKEIARQLRLRDIGGIIVCDFIDMESQENRNRVLHEMKSHQGRDRARTKAFEVSELGLIEMTRQRVRPSLLESLTEECGHCGGAGRVYTAPTVVRRVERTLQRVASAGAERLIVVRVHPEIALEILESERGFRQRMEKKTGLKIEIRDDPLLRQDEVRLMSGPAETDVTAKYLSG
ncbi:ribonuclease E/G [Gemmatimonadota bacterium]